MASYSVTAGVNEINLELPERSTVDDMIKILSQHYTKTHMDNPRTIVSVNSSICPRDRDLTDGDKVLIFHQMSGG